jgi:putative SOS response-associated peptidase YedK
MCFHSQQSQSAQSLAHRFNAMFENSSLFKPGIYNGFEFPHTPVITNTEPHTIQLFQWGLIPFWAKDDSIKKNTLNARIETIAQKPAFRNSVNNKCLILADGFFEWQWLDEKGKRKQKYLLMIPQNEPSSRVLSPTTEDSIPQSEPPSRGRVPVPPLRWLSPTTNVYEPFAFAGLWSEWVDKSTGELVHTYTILTTEANELMSKIHNTKKRMPVILHPDQEAAWLNGQELKMQNDRLVAVEV